MSKLDFFISLFALTFIFANNIIKTTIINQISEQNRKIKGLLIWLNLIPFINLFFPLIFNLALNDSVNKELKDSGDKISFFSYTGNVYPILILTCIPFYIRIFSIGSIGALNEFELIFFLAIIISVFLFLSLYLSEILSVIYFFNSGSKGKHSRNLLIFWGVLVIIITIAIIYQNLFSSEAMGVGYKVN